MVKQFKEFKQGYRYLVRDITNSEKLIDITVLEISEKAIKIEWYKDLVEWYLKDDLPFKFIEELSTTKQVIEDRSHEIQFDDMWCEKDEPDFTLRITEENDIEVKLKAEEKPKLEWQENPPEKPMTWNKAMEYAKSLGEGWRLPKREELIDAYVNKLEGFRSRFYWSSSTCDQNTNCAEYINFSYGYINLSNKADNNYVCCVREIK